MQIHITCIELETAEMMWIEYVHSTCLLEPEI